MSFVRIIIGSMVCSTLLSCQTIYTTYGFGKVARSLIKDGSTTLITMPENAPSISQRYRPSGISSQSGHNGFDILVPTGTEVLAAADGIIRSTKISLLYGRVIVIDHKSDNTKQRLQTRYFHLSEFKVKSGQSVKRGESIGLSGASGAAGVFPHLHFEVHKLVTMENSVSTRVLDPQAYWIIGVGKVSCFDPANVKYLYNKRLTYPVPCLVSNSKSDHLLQTWLT